MPFYEANGVHYEIPTDDPELAKQAIRKHTSGMITIGTSKPSEASFATSEGGAAFGNPNIGRRKREQPQERPIAPLESFAAGVTNRAIAQPAIGLTQFVTGGTVGGDKAREFETESTRYQQANPVAYGTGAVTGEVGKALALPLKNLGFVKGGAVYGGLSGAVTPNLSENTGLDYYSDQASNAALAAGLGAAGGAALRGGYEILRPQGIIHGAYKAGRNILNDVPIGAPQSAIQPVPSSVIKQATTTYPLNENFEQAVKPVLTPREAQSILNRGQEAGSKMVPVLDELGNPIIDAFTKKKQMEPAFGILPKQGQEWQATFEKLGKDYSSLSGMGIINKITGGTRTLLKDVGRAGIEAFKGKSTFVPGEISDPSYLAAMRLMGKEQTPTNTIQGPRGTTMTYGGEASQARPTPIKSIDDLLNETRSQNPTYSDEALLDVVVAKRAEQIRNADPYISKRAARREASKEVIMTRDRVKKEQSEAASKAAQEEINARRRAYEESAEGQAALKARAEAEARDQSLKQERLMRNQEFSNLHSSALQSKLQTNPTLAPYAEKYVVPDQIRDKVNAFTQGYTPETIVYGPPGTGKTSLASDWLEKNSGGQVEYVYPKMSMTDLELLKSKGMIGGNKKLFLVDEIDQFTPAQIAKINEARQASGNNVQILYTTNDIESASKKIPSGTMNNIEMNTQLTPEQKQVFGLNVARQYGVNRDPNEIAQISQQGQSFRDIKRAVTQGQILKEEPMRAMVIDDVDRLTLPDALKTRMRDFDNNLTSTNVMIINPDVYKSIPNFSRELDKWLPESSLDNLAKRFIGERPDSPVVRVVVNNEADAQKVASIKSLLEKSNEGQYPTKLLVENRWGKELDTAIQSRATGNIITSKDIEGTAPNLFKEGEQTGTVTVTGAPAAPIAPTPITPSKAPPGVSQMLIGEPQSQQIIGGKAEQMLSKHPDLPEGWKNALRKANDEFNETMRGLKLIGADPAAAPKQYNYFDGDVLVTETSNGVKIRRVVDENNVMVEKVDTFLTSIGDSKTQSRITFPNKTEVSVSVVRDPNTNMIVGYNKTLKNKDNKTVYEDFMDEDRTTSTLSLNDKDDTVLQVRKDSRGLYNHLASDTKRIEWRHLKHEDALSTDPQRFGLLVTEYKPDGVVVEKSWINGKSKNGEPYPLDKPYNQMPFELPTFADEVKNQVNMNIDYLKYLE